MATETSAPLIPSGTAVSNIDHVQIGMSESEVMTVMGLQLSVGYKKTSSSEMIEEISIKNPYKTENLEIKSKKYHVDYFYTAVKHPDNVITDDELTPLIFKNDQLIGKGSEFLSNLRR